MCFSSECHIFEDGYLTKCSIAHKYDVYCKHYNLPLPQEEFRLSLYDGLLTSEKLLRYLLNPNVMCRHCGKWRLFPWQRAGNDPPMEDWYGSGGMEK